MRVSKNQEYVEITIVRLDGSDGTISCKIETLPLFETQNPQNAVEFDDYLPVDDTITFKHSETEKVIKIKLENRIGEMEAKQMSEDKSDKESGSEEEEEPDVTFKVKMSNPQPNGVKMSKKNVCLVTITKSNDLEKEEDDKQKLIEYYLSQSDPTWGQQFKMAVMLGPSIDEDNITLEDVTLGEALTHFCSIGWKYIFALIPPPSYWSGSACFFISLTFIGLVTAIVGEVASLLGCAIGIKESVTAITLVALGTSLPDTFASMTAAKNSEYADSAIGNITGSNSVNVFLGLGLPWAIASTYWNNNGLPEGQELKGYIVPSGDLAFSVFVFLVCAVTCFIVLVARRCVIGGELGGPSGSKMASAVFLVLLWFVYILMCTLRAYGVIASE